MADPRNPQRHGRVAGHTQHPYHPLHYVAVPHHYPAPYPEHGVAVPSAAAFGPPVHYVAVAPHYHPPPPSTPAVKPAPAVGSPSPSTVTFAHPTPPPRPPSVYTPSYAPVAPHAWDPRLRAKRGILRRPPPPQPTPPSRRPARRAQPAAQPTIVNVDGRWYLPGNTPYERVRVPSITFEHIDAAFVLPDTVATASATGAAVRSNGVRPVAPGVSHSSQHGATHRSTAPVCRPQPVHEHHPNRHSPDARREAEGRVAALRDEVAALRAAQARQQQEVRALRAAHAAPDRVTALQTQVAALREEQAHRARAHYNPWAP